MIDKLFIFDIICVKINYKEINYAISNHQENV